MCLIKKVSVFFVCVFLSIQAGCQSKAQTGSDNGNAMKMNASSFDGLYDQKWLLQKIDHQTIEITHPAYLTISSNGEIKGFAGCNRFFGKIIIQSDKQTVIGPLGATRKMCQGEVMHVEDQFMAVLRKMIGLQRENMNLIVSDGTHQLFFGL